LQGCEIGGHGRAEARKAASESLEPAWDWVLEALRIDASEAISTAPTHRDESEIAPVAQEDHHFHQSGQAQGDDASPDHLPSIAWDGRGHRELADRRVDTVGSNHYVVPTGRAVAEIDRDMVTGLRQARQRNAQSDGHLRGSSNQHFLEPDAREAHAGPDIAPEVFEIGLAEHFAALIKNPQRRITAPNRSIPATVSSARRTRTPLAGRLIPAPMAGQAVLRATSSGVKPLRSSAAATERPAIPPTTRIRPIPAMSPPRAPRGL
jgi:hypothetical protein